MPGTLRPACRPVPLTSASAPCSCPGDDPTHIASGPCAPDPTTYQDALDILQRHEVKAPSAVNEHLARGTKGEIAETPKPGKKIFNNVENRIIATAQASLQAAAQFLAWQSIQNERDALNLDTFQRSQADTKVKESNDTVGSRIYQTWTLALVPAHKEPAPGEQVKPEDLVEWQEIPIGGTDPLAKRTATKVKNDGALIPALGGLTLRHHLDEKLWRDKDHVGVGQLTEWFARYLYLPRVVNRDVILGAIGWRRQPRTHPPSPLRSTRRRSPPGLQVRGGVIENTTPLQPRGGPQEADKAARRGHRGGDGPRQSRSNGPPRSARTGARSSRTCSSAPPSMEPRIPRRRPVAEEVLQHLSTLPGARVEVRLEVQVHVPDGVGDDVVRTVTENANTLKFDSHGFERE